MKRQVKSVVNVHIEPVGIEIEAPAEKSLLEFLLKNEIDISHVCEGMGTCGTCHIFVEAKLEELPVRNEIENERATELCFRNDERLACQNPVVSGMKIRIPHD